MSSHAQDPELLEPERPAPFAVLLGTVVIACAWVLGVGMTLCALRC